MKQEEKKPISGQMNQFAEEYVQNTLIRVGSKCHVLSQTKHGKRSKHQAAEQHNDRRIKESGKYGPNLFLVINHQSTAERNRQYP